MGDAPTRTPDAIDLYWRPGCMFCRSLERGLKRTGIPVRRHNIWEDPEAAAVVRRATGGSETVPTVLVGDEALVNPSASAVQALVRQVAPELESAGGAPRRRFWSRQGG